ncbi:MAG: hypothetical protein U9P90_02445 [Patescibacteria group bacterium]|nr:hypothetical protein [Patescibacteria group bacterium]
MKILESKEDTLEVLRQMQEDVEKWGRKFFDLSGACGRAVGERDWARLEELRKERDIAHEHLRIIFKELAAIKKAHEEGVPNEDCQS